MLFSKKAAALAAGLITALSAAGLAALAAPPNTKGDGPLSETLVVEEATVDWIEKANVAALREGNVEKMELQIGMPVMRGGEIGHLHREMAELAVRKAEVAVHSTAPRVKARAQQELALTTVALNKRLNDRIKGSVSLEEIAKAEAEVKVATAMIQEADEKTELDKAELELARQALKEHTIFAPFDGVVMERMKGPGESVRANEAVVKLGNLSKLRAYAYVPLEYSLRVKEGQIVEIQLRLAGERRSPLPIEQKRFRGKISFVDPQIQPIAETAVRVHAEFDNKDFELRPGYKATMTIYLNSEAAPAVGARSAPGLDR
jgi:RND family efflux transporter MFP subunit